mgnify:CR=1 FL=1
MKYLTQKHFYYGAILSAIIEYNPDASLVLLEQKEDVYIYEVKIERDLNVKEKFKANVKRRKLF